jgi:hypothetical protein
MNTKLKRKTGRKATVPGEVRTIMSIRLQPETKATLDMLVENRSQWVENVIRKELGLAAL